MVQYTHYAIHCNIVHHTATHSTKDRWCLHTRFWDGTVHPLCHTVQHSAPHCNKDNRGAKTSGLLRYTHTATHCNTLQHIATHCNTLQHTATLHSSALKYKRDMTHPKHTPEPVHPLRTASHCNTPQYTHTHKPKTLQHLYQFICFVCIECIECVPFYSMSTSIQCVPVYCMRLGAPERLVPGYWMRSGALECTVRKNAKESCHAPEPVHWFPCISSLPNCQPTISRQFTHKHRRREPTYWWGGFFQSSKREKFGFEVDSYAE